MKSRQARRAFVSMIRSLPQVGDEESGLRRPGRRLGPNTSALAGAQTDRRRGSRISRFGGRGLPESGEEVIGRQPGREPS